MVQPKHPKDFSAEEVGMWLVAIGLGSKAETFKEAGVDGSMLVILGADDFGELGISSLQGKKLMTSLETAKGMAEGGGGGAPDPDLLKQIQELKDENMALRQQLAAYQQPRAPAPAPPPPAPAPAPVQQKPPPPQR